jgi:hypothetical protein
VRFTIEIEATELGYILHGLSEQRARLAVKARQAKGDAKIELKGRLDTAERRYNELDLLLDQHATDAVA